MRTPVHQERILLMDILGHSKGTILYPVKDCHMLQKRSGTL